MSMDVTEGEKLATASELSAQRTLEPWAKLLVAFGAIASVVLSAYPCEQSDLLQEAGCSRKDFQTKRIVQSKGKAQDREELNDAPETIWISPGVESEAALRFDFGNNNRDEESGDAR